MLVFHSGPAIRSVPGKLTAKDRRTPPLTARGSPMRSKFVLVCHPSPLNPFPPCSAGTDGSAPASALVKTGYEFLSRETLPGAERWRRSARTACRWGGGASAARGRKQKSRQERRPPSHAVVSHDPPKLHSIRIIACNGAGVAPETGGLFDDLKRYIGSHGIQVRPGRWMSTSRGSSTVPASP